MIGLSARQVPTIESINTPTHTGFFQGLVWLGRKIKIFFTDRFFPFIRTIWKTTIKKAGVMLEALSSPLGIGIIGFGAFVLSGAYFLNLSDNPKLKEKRFFLIRISLKVLSVASFIVSGAVITAGAILALA